MNYSLQKSGQLGDVTKRYHQEMLGIKKCALNQGFRDRFDVIEYL